VGGCAVIYLLILWASLFSGSRSEASVGVSSEVVAPTAAHQDLGLVGKWRYFKKIYQGHHMPEPPEASLRLYFEFHADGVSRLYWWNEGERNWCERLGRYRIENNKLVDKITWVNPRNSNDCGRDPDMQMGRETATPIVVRDNEWELHMNLGDDTLVYVWQREAF
jgi:hypothetical protein